MLVEAASKWTCPAFNGGVQHGYVPYVKLSPIGTLKLALDKGYLAVGLHDEVLPWVKVQAGSKGSMSNEDIPEGDVSGFDVDLLRAVASNIAATYKQPLIARFRQAKACRSNCNREFVL
jgi:hypothetical protein